MKLILLVCVGLLATHVFGCQTSAQVSTNKVHAVEVFRGSKEVNPDKRTLTRIGRLGDAGIRSLESFIKGAKRKTFSYVLSTYYLDVIDESGKVQRRYGVVVDSDGQLGGLDITSDDPAKTHVTSRHSLLVNKGKELSTALIQAIRELEKPQSKASLPE